tara:strand:+ start:1071 stop:1319 length:249 start_codon:yes stop_codon:yes gene_type:complete
MWYQQNYIVTQTAQRTNKLQVSEVITNETVIFLFVKGGLYEGIESSINDQQSIVPFRCRIAFKVQSSGKILTVLEDDQYINK